MSESAKTIIKYFCDRFLNLDYYPTTLKAILELPLDNLKNLNKDDLAKFKKEDITYIRDLVAIEIEKIPSFSKKSQINEATIQSAVIASILISNAWSKRNAYLKKPQMKVVIAGLDFAGKTSLINRLITQQGYTNTVNLEPTVGANIEEFQSNMLNLVIWDLGGQKNHVEEYLLEPEKFFVQVDILIYVFDCQDDHRYDDAIKYLGDLIKILEFLNEQPYLMILLNKADPDLLSDPDFQIKLEYLTEKITNLFVYREKSWSFELTPTSIYNYYSKEPEIAKSIKNIFTKPEEPKKETGPLEIEEKLQRILDINLNLLDRVTTELAEIKRIISRLAPSDLSRSLFSVPFEKVPIDFIDESKKKRKSKREKEEPKKKKVEAKEEKETLIGPPKKLDILPVPKPVQDHKLEVTESIKQKAVLENPETPPTAPPLGPPPSIIPMEHLKPPPPPPKIAPNAPKPSIESDRKSVLLELKDLLKKRGIVR